MNKNELLVAIYSLSTTELLEKLLPLSDSERSHLASTAITEHRRIGRLEDSGDGADYQKKFAVLQKLLHKAGYELDSTPFLSFKQGCKTFNNNAALASLGCCAKTDAKKIALWRASNLESFLMPLFKARKPDWLAEWLEHHLIQEYPDINWELVEFCITEKLCPRLTSDGYIQLMLSGLHHYHDKKSPTLLKELERLPWLFEYEIWRIFEVDNWEFEKNHRRSKGHDWAYALITVSEKKPEYRPRLLKKALEGLLLNLKNPVHQGFIHFYNQFEITDHERQNLETTYFALLKSPKSFIINFALKELQHLQKAQMLLNLEMLLQHLQPILGGTVKNQQKQALSIAKSILKQTPTLFDNYLTLLCHGLCTSNADIQQQLLDILIQQRDKLSPLHQQLILDVKNIITPSLIQSYRELCADPQQANDDGLELDTPDIDQKQLSHYSLSDLEALGLEELLTDINAPLKPNKLHEIQPTQLIPIEPISDQAMLVSEITESMAFVDEAERYEAILDGISRLHLQTCENFELLTDPIRKSLEKGPAEKGLCSLRFGIYELNRLLLQWISGHQKIREDSWYMESKRGIGILFSRRVKEVKQRLLQGIEAPLLAMPTHKGGWLDVMTLLQRMDDYSQQGLGICNADFEQALMRLLPMSSTSLASLPKQENIYYRLVYFALGADDSFDDLESTQSGLWITAARRRQPWASITHLAPHNLSSRWNPYLEEGSYHWQLNEHNYISTFQCKFSLEEDEKPLLKYPIQHSGKSVPHLTPLWNISVWLTNYSSMLIKQYASVMPCNQDVLFANGITALLENIEKGANADSHLYALFEPFFNGYRTMNHISYQLLATALNMKNQDVQGSAIEVCAILIDEGFLQEEKLIHSFNEIVKMEDEIYHSTEQYLNEMDCELEAARTYLIKSQRLNQALLILSDFSPCHRLWVKSLLERYIQSWERRPQSPHLFLEQLLQHSHQLKIGINEKIKPYLSEIKGSTKLAKAAKQLLQINFPTSTKIQEQCRLQQIQTRIQVL